MKVKLLFFASLSERLGRRCETREVPEGASAELVWRLLLAENPALSGAPRPAFARNAEQVDGKDVLEEGDEVAFLPPVGGG